MASSKPASVLSRSCSACEDKSAVSFCFKCKTSLCTECEITHKETFKRHHVQAMQTAYERTLLALGMQQEKKEDNVSENFPQLPKDVRYKMMDGRCDNETKKILKESGLNYEIAKDTEIPRAIGLYYSMVAPKRDFQALQQKAIDIKNGSWSPDGGKLLTEELDEKLETIQVTFDLEGPAIEIYDFLDVADVDALEETYGIIIEESTTPDLTHADDYTVPQLDGPDDEDMPGLRLDSLKLEVDCDKKGFNLYFCCEDMSKFVCDAVVNTCTPSMAFDGCLSGDIRRKGGHEMVKEVQDYVTEHGDINYGDIYVSLPGDLHVKNIMHVSAPVWRKHSNAADEVNPLVYHAVTQILKEADSRDLYSLGIPAISAGGFSFPIAVSLLSIFSAVHDYFEERSKSDRSGVLREIYLVDNNPRVIEEAKNAMGKCFGDEKVYDNDQKKEKNAKTFCVKILGKVKQKFKGVIQKLGEKCKGIVAKVKKIPSHWSPMHTEHFTKEALSTDSVEYIQLEKEFAKDMGNITVDKIERVQNPRVYERFLRHKDKIQREIGWTENYEMVLYHGTTQTNVQSIMQNGFDSKCIRVHAYGKGLYFAHSPTVSAAYAYPNGDGLHHIFRCKVVVGRIHEESNYERNKTSAPDGYQTVLANNKRYYVVFRDTLIYPEYLICYRKVNNTDKS